MIRERGEDYRFPAPLWRVSFLLHSKSMLTSSRLLVGIFNTHACNSLGATDSLVFIFGDSNTILSYVVFKHKTNLDTES